MDTVLFTDSICLISALSLIFLEKDWCVTKYILCSNGTALTWVSARHTCVSLTDSNHSAKISGLCNVADISNICTLLGCLIKHDSHTSPLSLSLK